MGTRIKTFVATGVAPDGRLFPGDLNAMQDQYADQTNLAQTLAVGTIQVGETGLQVVRYGAGEMRITGAVRTDGIIRGLGGLYSGAFTTTQRDAIAAGFRPYGLVILNTTTNRLEINLGSDASPSWSGLAAAISRGILGSRPGPSVSNANSWYFATDDQGGTLYYSDGSVWTKTAKGLTEAPVAHQGSHVANGSDALPWTTINGSGILGSRPAAAATNAGYTYFATDDAGGTLYRSTGSVWTKIAVSLSDAALTNARTPTAHHATHELGGSDVLDFTLVVGGAGLLASRPGAATRNGQLYFATDNNGGTMYRSDGATWTQTALGVTQAPTIADGSLTPAKISGTAVVTSDSRLSDQRVPTANSVNSSKIIDGSIAKGDLAWNTLETPDGSGLLVKFGHVTVAPGGADAQATVNFPTPFPNNVFSVVAINGDYAASGRQWWPDVYRINNSAFGFRATTGGGNGITSGVVTIDYIAIGN